MLHPFLRALQKSTSVQYVGGYTTSILGSTSDQTITFGGNLTGGLASSAAENDLVVVFYHIGSPSGFATATITGYKLVTSVAASASYDSSLYLFGKFMGPTPDTNFVIVGGTGSSTNAATVAVQVWRNVDLSVLYLRPTTSSATNTALPNPPSITPTASGTVVLVGGGAGHSRGTQTFTSSDLSNFITVGCDDSYDSTIGAGSFAWSSGTFDAAQFGFTGVDATTYSSAAAILPIAPSGPTFDLSSFLGFTNNGRTTNGTSLTLDKPTRVIDNDLLVMILSCVGNSANTYTVNGWTQAYSRSGNGSFSIYYKTASSEGSSYTVTASLASVHAGVILAFRGYTWDTIGTVNTTSATSMTASSITVSSNNSWLLGFASLAKAGVSESISEPLNYTLGNYGPNASGPLQMAVGKKVDAGSSGSLSFTISSDANNTAVLLALKPT